MDQQEDIQERPGFEQDMEHSAAVDYIRVKSYLSHCKITSHTSLIDIDTSSTIILEPL